MILVIIWRSHVPSEKNDEYIYLETHKQETLYDNIGDLVPP